MTPAEVGMERIRMLVKRLIEDGQTRRAALNAIETAYGLGKIAGLEEAREITLASFGAGEADETRPQ